MPFDINPVPSITREVTITAPDGTTGQLEFEWKYLPRDARKKLIARMNEATEQYQQQYQQWVDGDLEAEPEHTINDQVLAEDLLLNITGLTDKGEPVEYSPQLLPQLMNLDWYAEAIGKELRELIWQNGYLQVLEKNSPTPDTTG